MRYIIGSMTQVALAVTLPFRDHHLLTIFCMVAYEVYLLISESLTSFILTSNFKLSLFKISISNAASGKASKPPAFTIYMSVSPILTILS